MQCVILAAGRGTRMLPLTATAPKPLLQYKGKSILEWNLENLPREITEVIFVIGYLDKKIRSFVRALRQRRMRLGGRTPRIKAAFVEQNELNGTGGALLLCKNILQDKFLVINGDDLYDVGDLSRLLAHKLAMLGFWSRDWPGSSLLLDESGCLEGIEANPPAHEEKIANAGAYLLDKRFFNYPLSTIKNGKEYSLPHTLVTVSRDHKIFVERAAKWKHINTPEDLIV